ncbi:hypothetical protein MLD38_018411 [Melastoma candidum]|uniref:Uncharacterized protein n=1 Tax=Melastoma candidum TaxID=119954 RepID=A0ACB9QX88_9MYRT|nr:hypothetical protein MLD38_018411 [Melastoma candidum]
MSQESPSTAGDLLTGPRSPSLDERIRLAVESDDQEEAVRLNTEGITLYPQDPKYPLGRAAANFFLNNYHEARADAMNALLLDPDNKIHRSQPFLYLSRSLVALMDYDSAFTMASAGLGIDPKDGGLIECLEFAQIAGIAKRDALRYAAGMDDDGDTFNGGEMWLKLENSAEAKGYRHDPEFHMKVFEARTEVLKLAKHLKEDERVLKSLGILLQVRFGENIGGGGNVSDFEWLGFQDDEKGNEDPLRETLREIISTVVNYTLPELMNLSLSLEEQERDGEPTTKEEAELDKVSSKGASRKRRRARVVYSD